MRGHKKINHGDWVEHQITLEGIFSVSDLKSLIPCDSVVVSAECFGSENLIREWAISSNIPTSLIRNEVRAVRLRCISGGSITPLFEQDTIVGNILETNKARYVFITGLHPTNPAADRGVQAEDVFMRLHTLLNGVGMKFENLVRTWFYNECILVWYEDFNRVRSSFFSTQSLPVFPASTCVGATNLRGSAILANAIVVTTPK